LLSWLTRRQLRGAQLVLTLGPFMARRLESYTSSRPRVEWVPLALVPQMIDAGEIWSAGTLVALSRVLMNNR